MTGSKYNHDKRHQHGYFKIYQFLGKSLVFVMYRKEDKKSFDLERFKIKQELLLITQQKLGIQKQALSADEFMNQFQKSNRDKDLINQRENIYNKAKRVILDLFPQIPFIVEIYGSTRSGSCNYGTDLNICIRFDDTYLISNATKDQGLNETLFDIKKGLQKDFKYIKIEINSRQQPFLEFSHNRISCTLCFDYKLGLETSQSIAEYVKLDKRVGPFIYAVKWFVLSHGINFENGGYPNSYDFTIMALYFLMNVLENPIIPNLQNFQGSCHTYNCSWYSDNDRTILNELNTVNVSFHDCVYIHNNATDKYNTDKSKSGTIWYGENKSHLVTLLTSFFTYFSDEKNFKNISIMYDSKKDWSKHCIVIQDPFLKEKNIAETCFQSLLDYIIYKFNNAAIELHKGNSFEQVCSP